VFTASFSCVKRFFLNKNLSDQDRPGGRRRRLSKEGRSPCQPNFRTFFEAIRTGVLQAANTASWRLEGLPVGRSDDSIEGAEPNRDALRNQEAVASFFRGAWRLASPAAPASGPFPSEAAIYAATF